MENTPKQTAVEWLESTILSISVGRASIDRYKVMILKLIAEAKQMEKEQIVNAYDAGLFDGTMDDVNDRIYKQYYNEEYGK